MSSWLITRMYRNLDRIKVPRYFLGSGLAFVGSLALDRHVFIDLTRPAQAVFLSSNSLAFLLADHPLTVYTIAIPVVFVFKQHLLSSGGINLMLGIQFASRWASNQFHKYRSWCNSKEKEQESSFGIEDRDGDIPFALHQLAYWYLVPRASFVWEMITDFLDGHRSRKVSVCGMYIGLGAWCLLPYTMPMVKVYYPRIYAQLLHYLRERPLSHLYAARKIIRQYVDRLIFMSRFKNSSTYQYHQLDHMTSEIRLLKLHAGDGWNILKADLISVSISEAPQFEAISYRWASGEDVPILLDNYRFLVSGEVHEILRTLRYQHEDRLLWLDSICIDQNNINEKEWQIEFMTQIYGTCTRVIGWIAVMRQIPFLPGQLSWLAELAALQTSPEDYSNSVVHGDMCSKMRASIITLCNEFSFRIWIIQEVALAPNLVLKFGDEEMPWDVFYHSLASFMEFYITAGIVANFAPIMHTRMAQASLNIRFMEEFRVDRRDQREGLPLSQLLIGSVDFEATDPRDRVFGLLGLSTQGARDAISVSYLEDISDMAVLMQAVTFTLIGESSFILLEISGIGHLPAETESGFPGPSWVPRWGFQRISYLKSFASTCNSLYETGTWATRTVIANSLDSRCLQIQGMYVDRIQFLSEPWLALQFIVDSSYTTFEQAYIVYSKLLDDMLRAVEVAQQAHHPSYAEINCQSLVWRTICHDSQKLNRENHSFDADGKEVEDAVRCTCVQLGGLYERGVRESYGTDVVENLTWNSGVPALAHLLPMQGTRLCVTEKGYFGVVPPYTKEGDEVWAFSGARNPFVLRGSPAPTDPQEWQAHRIVGVCYIDGIMNGQLKGSGIPPTTVNLV